MKFDSNNFFCEEVISLTIKHSLLYLPEKYTFFLICGCSKEPSFYNDHSTSAATNNSNIIEKRHFTYEQDQSGPEFLSGCSKEPGFLMIIKNQQQQTITTTKTVKIIEKRYITYDQDQFGPVSW